MPQMAEWRMCIACWIPKATNALSSVYANGILERASLTL